VRAEVLVQARVVDLLAIVAALQAILVQLLAILVQLLAILVPPQVIQVPVQVMEVVAHKILEAVLQLPILTIILLILLQEMGILMQLALMLIEQVHRV
jgi:hypothetical protein